MVSLVLVTFFVATAVIFSHDNIRADGATVKANQEPAKQNNQKEAIEDSKKAASEKEQKEVIEHHKEAVSEKDPQKVQNDKKEIPEKDQKKVLEKDQKEVKEKEQKEVRENYEKEVEDNHKNEVEDDDKSKVPEKDQIEASSNEEENKIADESGKHRSFAHVHKKAKNSAHQIENEKSVRSVNPDVQKSIDFIKFFCCPLRITCFC